MVAETRRQSIFVSHNRNDKPEARRLANALRGLGCDVWFDEWSVRPGESLVGGIEDGLAGMDVLVLLWSESAAESNWVGTELRATVRRRVDDAKLRIVPVLLDDTPLPVLVAEFKGLMLADFGSVVEVAAEVVDVRTTSVREALAELLDRLEAAYEMSTSIAPGEAIPTGFTSVDRLIGGTSRGRLYAVVGVDGAGQLHFALAIANRQMVTSSLSTLVVSYDHSAAQLCSQMLFSSARVDAARVQSGAFDDNDWRRVTEAVGEMATLDLSVLDDAPPELDALIHVVRQVNRDNSIDLLVLQGLPNHSGESLRALRRLARELSAAVVVVVSLADAPTERPAVVPLDIRTAADVVLVVHRPELFDVTTTDAGKAEIVVAKNRDGQTGTAQLAFTEAYGHFANIVHGVA